MNKRAKSNTALFHWTAFMAVAAKADGMITIGWWWVTLPFYVVVVFAWIGVRTNDDT